MKKFLIITAAALCLIAGCRLADPDAPAELRIAVSEGAQTRGIESTSMETAYYMVKIVNESKGLDAPEFRVEKNGGEAVKDVPTGSTTVRVDAYNAEGIKIGTGSNTVMVKPLAVNRVTVTVEELKVPASVTVKVTTTASDLRLTAKFFKAGQTPGFGTVAPSVELSAVSGGYSASRNLDNGFYKLFIYDEKGNVQAGPVGVRVAAGQAVTVTADIEDNWKITITIDNRIVATPEVRLEGGLASYAAGASYSITAEVTGLVSPKYAWYLDGELLSGQTGKTVTGKIPSDIKKGTHYFSCVAEKGEVVWAASHEFTVAE